MEALAFAGPHSTRLILIFLDKCCKFSTYIAAGAQYTFAAETRRPCATLRLAGAGTQVGARAHGKFVES
jgi:hypothetical protein